MNKAAPNFSLVSQQDDKYWYNVTQIYKYQRNKGVKRYGKTLEENTASLEDRIAYFQEEMVDALMYAEWIKEKIKVLPRPKENEFDIYQYLAMRTANKKASVRDLITQACIGMCGEVGEFCNLWEKHYSQGHHFCDVEEQLNLELGDILWYLTLACEALGVSLGDVAKYNVEKLEARYKNSDGSVDFTPEKSEDRRDENGE